MDMTRRNAHRASAPTWVTIMTRTRLMSRRWWTALTVAIVLLVVVVTCVVITDRKTSSSAATTLDRLPVVTRSIEDPGYRRAEFGSGWADLDGDGCRTRDEVLLNTVDRSQPYRVQRQGRCRADMVAGTWTHLYSGRSMTWSNLKDPTQAESFPIDHIVALAEAHRDGAKGWTRQRRVEFANDELNLTPTTAALNSSKSDKGPADWNPPVPGRCAYATRYIAVKDRYRLPVDKKEKDALHRLLKSCRPSSHSMKDRRPPHSVAHRRMLPVFATRLGRHRQSQAVGPSC